MLPQLQWNADGAGLGAHWPFSDFSGYIHGISLIFFFLLTPLNTNPQDGE